MDISTTIITAAITAFITTSVTIMLKEILWNGAVHLWFKLFPKRSPAYKNVRDKRYEVLLNYLILFKEEVSLFCYACIRAIDNDYKNTNPQAIDDISANVYTELLAKIKNFCELNKDLLPTIIYLRLMELDFLSIRQLLYYLKYTTNREYVIDINVVTKHYHELLDEINEISVELNKIIAGL